MYWQVASGQRPLTNGRGMIFWLQGWLASAPSEAQQGTRHLENCLFAINIVVITIHAILTIPRLQSICSLSLLPATTSQDLVRLSICQSTKSWRLPLLSWTKYQNYHYRLWHLHDHHHSAEGRNDSCQHVWWPCRGPPSPMKHECLVPPWPPLWNTTPKLPCFLSLTLLLCLCSHLLCFSNAQFCFCNVDPLCLCNVVAATGQSH